MFNFECLIQNLILMEMKIFRDANLKKNFSTQILDCQWRSYVGRERALARPGCYHVGVTPFYDNN